MGASGAGLRRTRSRRRTATRRRRTGVRTGDRQRDPRGRRPLGWSPPRGTSAGSCGGSRAGGGRSAARHLRHVSVHRVPRDSDARLRDMQCVPRAVRRLLRVRRSPATRCRGSTSRAGRDRAAREHACGRGPSSSTHRRSAAHRRGARRRRDVHLLVDRRVVGRRRPSDRLAVRPDGLGTEAPAIACCLDAFERARCHRSPRSLAGHKCCDLCLQRGRDARRMLAAHDPAPLSATRDHRGGRRVSGRHGRGRGAIRRGAARHAPPRRALGGAERGRRRGQP